MDEGSCRAGTIVPAKSTARAGLIAHCAIVPMRMSYATDV